MIALAAFGKIGRINNGFHSSMLKCYSAILRACEVKQLENFKWPETSTEKISEAQK
jgi:hypothetical protein